MSEETYLEASRSVAAAFGGAVVAYATTNGAHDDATVEAAIDELRERLARWAELPARAQRAVPLQIVRDVLAPLGVDGPMTSRDLGEAAFAAHVAWGIARAQEIAGVVPTQVASEQHTSGAVVAVVSGNLLDRERIVETVRAKGGVPVVWRNPADVADGLTTRKPQLAVVDLQHAAAMDVIRLLADGEVRSIGFGPHVDDHLLAAARSVGADEVLPRSVFFRRLESLLPVAL